MFFLILNHYFFVPFCRNFKELNKMADTTVYWTLCPCSLLNLSLLFSNGRTNHKANESKESLCIRLWETTHVLESFLKVISLVLSYYRTNNNIKVARLTRASSWQTSDTRESDISSVSWIRLVQQNKQTRTSALTVRLWGFVYFVHRSVSSSVLSWIKFSSGFFFFFC